MLIGICYKHPVHGRIEGAGNPPVVKNIRIFNVLDSTQKPLRKTFRIVPPLSFLKIVLLNEIRKKFDYLFELLVKYVLYNVVLLYINMADPVSEANINLRL